MKPVLLRGLRAAAAAAAMACAPTAFAAEPPWPAEAPYSYFANAAKLETVLADFATGFSMSLSIDPAVSGTVNGRFATKSPTEFISKLASVYGFVWYAHAGTLFVSRASDAVTKGISAPGGNVGSMRKALADLGVLEPRFGWGELADHGMAIVSGPPSYIQLVENTIRNLPARAQQLKVVRLRHASAQDRTVPYRDQQLTIPGLATILRSMVAGGVATAAPSTTSATVRPLTPLGGEPLPTAPAAALPATAQPGAQPAAAQVSSGGPRPSIQAEPRLNALIIQDVPERMPLYIDKINSAGGVSGQRIEVVSMDDKFDPKLAGENARVLVEEKNVLALFLTRGTPHTEAIIPVLNKHSVPLVGPSTGAMVLHTPLQKHVFNVRSTYQREAEKAILHLSTIGMQRIAVVHADDSFCADGLEGANKGFALAEIAPLAIIKADRSKPDYGPIINRIVNARAHAVLWLGSGNAVADGVHKLGEAGSAAQVITLSNNASSGFIKSLGAHSQAAGSA